VIFGPDQTPDPNPFDEHTRLWADEIGVRLCRRCGHSSDVHSHDDVNDEHEATDPDCPFRCQQCDCPDFMRQGAA
jgi:hypothetical protein